MNLSKQSIEDAADALADRSGVVYEDLIPAEQRQWQDRVYLVLDTVLGQAGVEYEVV